MQLDDEWIFLIYEAKKLGLTKQEVLDYLNSKKSK
ncbi:anti-repressor SinI family protein [Cytobacillus kochii]|nr:anti-repressor SinI family protein [Cytobacillus kochii]MCA1025650.1 anti-repressor SinI family protein [Cytobacillus kochii]